MQLVKLSNKLRPLTLAAGLFSAVTTFAYSDLDNYSGILTMTSNYKTSEYIKLVDKSDESLLLRKFKFDNHLINWQKRTMFLSSTKAIIENEDFQSIVAMGHSAVPYIIEEIENRPSTLVWALNLIYNQKITNNPNATISEACNLWVKQLKK
ncbi:MAG: hypothetical protein FD181_2387 [Prolixibacteraceae bacterium]|nr:MAG: hypothetical protein FD181_2387 [Prolixibacteraceae bacterium]